MTALTPRERWTVGGLGVVYAALVVVLRVQHGGDVVPEIELSERWLSGEALYRSGLSLQGTHWPPFAALALAPFALLARASLAVATAAWSIFSVACLAAAVSLARRWGERGWPWKPAVLALLATAVPLQTNFEHRNVNTVLLLLVVAAAADLEEAREARAGVWLGLAAAIKAFPALLLVYLAVRGYWRALAVATAVAAGGTLVVLAPYGVEGAIASVADWLRLALDQGRWPVTTSDQSLRALVFRFGGPPWAAAGIAAACVGAGLAIARRRPGKTGVLPGLGTVTLAAVLASPIAWVHYYVLAFPAWLAVLRSAGPLRAAHRAALAFAAIATSGWLTVGPRSLRAVVLGSSSYAWGGLVLLALVAARAWQPTGIGTAAPDGTG